MITESHEDGNNVDLKCIAASDFPCESESLFRTEPGGSVTVTCSLDFDALRNTDATRNSETDGADTKAAFSASRNSGKRVFLNVGGTRNEVLWSTLLKFPNTRLGRLATENFSSLYDLCDDFNLQASEFFFDHHTELFPSIISYHRSGKFHLIGDFCFAQLPASLDYWGLKEEMLEPCCARKCATFKESIMLILQEEELEAPSEQYDFGSGKCAEFRLKLWQTLEMPTSSTIAKVWSTVSVTFIVLSTAMLVLGTTQWFQEFMDSLYERMHMNVQLHNTNNLSSANWSVDSVQNGTLLGYNATQVGSREEEEDQEHPLISLVEMVCIIWFTLEYCLRFCASPDKKQFLKSELNIIDLLSILPYFIAASISGYSQSLTSKFTTARKLMQLLRILRILRVFKIARHSTGLKALGFTVKQSYRELGMIVLFLVLGVLFFSTLCYYLEKDAAGSKFTSIPEAFWYTAISMTTVGYGDITPTTPMGKLVGIVCCLCGVLVIALPIPIVVSSFTEYLTRQRRVRTRYRSVC